MDPTNIALHALGVDLVGVGVRLIALLVIPVNRRPSSAMAWLLAIFLIPYVGIIAFLMIGNPKLPKRRRAQQREINGMLDVLTRDTPELELEPGQEWVGSIARLNRNLGSLPMIGGNAATLIEDYEDSLQQMADGSGRRGALRPVRVLHPQRRRHHEAVLRFAGTRGEARADGARAVRPHRLEARGRATGRRRAT